MIRSMTGYGAAELATERGRLGVEIRSVNHRYCEISLRLPKTMTLLEGRVRTLITERLLRGKITVSVTWEGYESDGGRLTVNHDLVRQYVHMLTELKDKYNLAGDPELGDIAALPDVFQWERVPTEDDESWGILRRALDAAVDDMASMKVREGAVLRREFEARLAKVTELLARAELRAAARPQEAQERMMARLRPLMGDLEVDVVRVAQEIALLAERLDCTEECVRLRAHLEQFGRLLDDPELAGRKLNFLLQEMNREVNTLGSKSNDVEIAEVVIDLKDEIEKLREQVQNVE